MRDILCADALPWLRDSQDVGAIITSPPDLKEMPQFNGNVAQYVDWLDSAIELCMEAISPDCPVIFCQTDRKYNGGVISKAGLILTNAFALDYKVLWHKIVVRTGIDKVDLYRPGYSHLIAVGTKSCKPGKATPDVIQRGGLVYENGFPFNAARLALEYLKALGVTNRVVDPFCGRGTIPTMAEAMGFEALGIDISEEQCAKARLLQTAELQ